MAKRKKRLSREDKKQQKIDAVLECFRLHKLTVDRPHLTASKIAKHLKVSASSKLRSFLAELCDMDILEMIPATHWNGWSKWYYCLKGDCIRQENLGL